MGGESTVKSVKTHIRKILGEACLNFAEYSTILAQIEACLNSQSLVPLTSDEDGMEALTPGHFLIGPPLEALSDSLSSTPLTPMPHLHRWNLCQLLTQHFGRDGPLTTSHLCAGSPSDTLSRNVQVGDLVMLKED